MSEFISQNDPSNGEITPGYFDFRQLSPFTMRHGIEMIASSTRDTFHTPDGGVSDQETYYRVVIRKPNQETLDILQLISEGKLLTADHQHETIQGPHLTERLQKIGAYLTQQTHPYQLLIGSHWTASSQQLTGSFGRLRGVAQSDASTAAAVIIGADGTLGTIDSFKNTELYW